MKILHVAFILGAVLIAPQQGTRIGFDSNELAELKKNAAVKFYPVNGEKVEDVKAAMIKSGPTDLSGKWRTAYTAWHLKWHWPQENGQPKFSDLTVHNSIVVSLPLWVDYHKATVAAQQSWDSYFGATVRHELNHVKLAQQGALKLKRRLLGRYKENPKATTTEMNQIGYQIVNEIKIRDQQYDINTEHGKSEGVVL